MRKKDNTIVKGDTYCDKHNHPVTELLYKNHPLIKQRKLKSNSITSELVENLILTQADRHDAIY